MVSRSCLNTSSSCCVFVWFLFASLLTVLKIKTVVLSNERFCCAFYFTAQDSSETEAKAMLPDRHQCPMVFREAKIQRGGYNSDVWRHHCGAAGPCLVLQGWTRGAVPARLGAGDPRHGQPRLGAGVCAGVSLSGFIRLDQRDHQEPALLPETYRSLGCQAANTQAGMLAQCIFGQFPAGRLFVWVFWWW